MKYEHATRLELNTATNVRHRRESEKTVKIEEGKLTALENDNWLYYVLLIVGKDAGVSLC